jgi:protease-4
VLPNVNRLSKRWGINAEHVVTNKQALQYSPFEPLPNSTRNEIKAGINQVYQTFLTRVAEGRGMTKDEVHKIAQGRVWSGIEAKAIGLVDHLGGLDLALERAAALAEIEDYRLTTYPKFDDDLESILEGLLGGPFGKLRTQLPPEISLWIQGIEALENPANQLQTRLPYTLNVN